MYITLILGNGLKVNEKMHPNISKPEIKGCISEVIQ